MSHHKGRAIRLCEFLQAGVNSDDINGASAESTRLMEQPIIWFGHLELRHGSCQFEHRIAGAAEQIGIEDAGKEERIKEFSHPPNTLWFVRGLMDELK